MHLRTTCSGATSACTCLPMHKPDFQPLTYHATTYLGTRVAPNAFVRSARVRACATPRSHARGACTHERALCAHLAVVRARCQDVAKLRVRPRKPVASEVVAEVVAGVRSRHRRAVRAVQGRPCGVVRARHVLPYGPVMARKLRCQVPLVGVWIDVVDLDQPVRAGACELLAVVVHLDVVLRVEHARAGPKHTAASAAMNPRSERR